MKIHICIFALIFPEIFHNGEFNFTRNALRLKFSRIFFWLNWCIFKNNKFRHVFCQNLSSFIGNKPTDKQSLYLYKRHKEPYLSYNPKHPRLANCFVSVSSRVKKSVPELLNRDIITLNPKPT